MNRLTVGLLATFAAILLGSGVLAYVLRDRSGPEGFKGRLLCSGQNGAQWRKM